jgi:hypothetical protein
MEEPRGKERRRDDRRRLTGAATLFWRVAGYDSSCMGNAYDISDTGLLVEAPQCILVGTRTSVRIDGSGQSMEAIVRHCRKHGAWYRIGLEFGRLNAAQAARELNRPVQSITVDPSQPPR